MWSEAFEKSPNSVTYFVQFVDIGRIFIAELFALSVHVEVELFKRLLELSSGLWLVDLPSL